MEGDQQAVERAAAGLKDGKKKRKTMLSTHDEDVIDDFCVYSFTTMEACQAYMSVRASQSRIRQRKRPKSQDYDDPSAGNHKKRARKDAGRKMAGEYVMDGKEPAAASVCARTVGRPHARRTPYKPGEYDLEWGGSGSDPSDSDVDYKPDGEVKTEKTDRSQLRRVKTQNRAASPEISSSSDGADKNSKQQGGRLNRGSRPHHSPGQVATQVDGYVRMNRQAVHYDGGERPILPKKVSGGVDVEAQQSKPRGAYQAGPTSSSTSVFTSPMPAVEKQYPVPQNVVWCSLHVQLAKLIDRQKQQGGRMRFGTYPPAAPHQSVAVATAPTAPTEPIHAVDVMRQPAVARQRIPHASSPAVQPAVLPARIYHGQPSYRAQGPPPLQNWGFSNGRQPGIDRKADSVPDKAKAAVIVGATPSRGTSGNLQPQSMMAVKSELPAAAPTGGNVRVLAPATNPSHGQSVGAVTSNLPVSSLQAGGASHVIVQGPVLMEQSASLPDGHSRKPGNYVLAATSTTGSVLAQQVPGGNRPVETYVVRSVPAQRVASSVPVVPSVGVTGSSGGTVIPAQTITSPS